MTLKLKNEEILNLHNLGKTPKEIGLILGCDFKTVKYRLNKLSIVPNKDIRSYKKARNLKKIRDLSNKKFGKLNVLYIDNEKKERVRWICQCDCGTIKSIISKHLVSGSTISCGCLLNYKGKNHHSFKGFEKIPGKYFTQIKRNALSRNLEFNITINQMWDLFLKQNKKCSLTGLDIDISTESKSMTASLDRIDSLKGYNIENVQWVHKHVNKMKMDFCEERFFEICKLVTGVRSEKNISKTIQENK